LNKIIFTFTIFLILIGFTNFASAASYIDPVVIIETNLGYIVIEFFVHDAPTHTSNFIYLSNSGFYDNTLFHRIIPGFMIQGGDPNTINGEPNTWGQGGSDEKLDAEFNTIKHNRGIVSMARGGDVNSAGSQFFIVHQDSHFLDGEYTVFGRIATQDSFDTLDKIAEVQTDSNDKPINPEQVKIIKASMLSRGDIDGLFEYQEPERTDSEVIKSTGKQIFENKELDIRFSVPEGWLLQQPSKTMPNSPDVVAVGPKFGGINPYISLTIDNTEGKTIDDLILTKNNILNEAVYLDKLEILSQEKIKSNVYQTMAIGNFDVDGELLEIKFIEVLILVEGKSYIFAYSNTIDNFDENISRFNDSLNSFEIISTSSPNVEESEGGGCLIATATYGSELAPQVQQLRELRDNQLLQTASGTQFMGAFNDIYYSFSPTIADMEREHPMFKEAVKLTITPMISTLSLMDNAESESEVLSIGISVIVLNLGMYLGVPAVVIIGIRKKF